MEGDSAVKAVHGPELEKYQKEGKPVPEDLQRRIEKTRADYERWLDSKFAAARGHVDAIIDPLSTRRILTFALETCMYKKHSEHLVLETL
jgi:acetyl-CoA carboxylase carboxyltransferase component